MADVVMPRLSDSMEEGTILQWLKQVGEDVAVGDELVEIETDKANMAYESDVAGKLVEIVADEGETLPIGSVIARIGEGSDAPAAGPVVGGVWGGRGGRPTDRPPPPKPPRHLRRLRSMPREAPSTTANVRRLLPWRGGSQMSAVSIWGSFRGLGREDASSRQTWNGALPPRVARTRGGRERRRSPRPQGPPRP
jgi:pyruvate/2-oxoglutarate dehydrogenase complex dihydrolipoamide acyltransferase (E2) component